ncbi:hypothetical protein PRZ48_013288 [Zasmidium cellare]|uniref:EthD domain-containing protein n=1 Tax=Zasmidium cellare TaxID=395010 RepID=A0ABR0E3W5_ZASCE|nr:hypothetical protein PRZ48_013288 [Zasmidium cellare]
MNKPASGPDPGLLYVNSKIIQPDKLSPEQYTRWYEETHIPDIFQTAGIDQAYRWQALDPAAERPYLALYPLKDTNFLQSSEFKAIPVEEDELPGTKIFNLANFDTRYYKFVQLYEVDNPRSEPPNLVISAGFTPADDEDYENWYQQEHLEEISGISTWRKTERYKLFFSRENRKPPEQREIPHPPKYLTLHFFDGDLLPEEELAKASESEWTKKNMSTMKDAQIMAFKRLSYYKK